MNHIINPNRIVVTTRLSIVSHRLFDRPHIYTNTNIQPPECPSYIRQSVATRIPWLEVCPFLQSFNPSAQSTENGSTRFWMVLQSTDSRLDRSHSSGVGTVAVRFQLEFEGEFVNKQANACQCFAHGLAKGTYMFHRTAPHCIASRRVALIPPSTPT